MSTLKSLIIGDTNQIIEKPGKHYNVEEYKTCMQFTGPWDEDHFCEIHIVKIYNVCTMYISSIHGQLPNVIKPETLIRGVPWTLTPLNVVDYPNQAPKNVTGRIPTRFLMRNSPSDILDNGTNNEAFWKSLSVPGIHNSTGFGMMLTIKNDKFDVGDNGLITFSFNMSAVGFTQSDTSIQPSCVTYLAPSNINANALNII